MHGLLPGVLDRTLNGEVSSRAKLSDALLPRHHQGFSSFAALPSNIRAVESALLFSNGLAPLVVILGVPGWGKSHLLGCAAGAALTGPEHDRPVPAALEWLRTSSRTDVHSPLLLDDCQEAFRLSRPRHELRLILERRVRMGRATMLSFEMSHADRALRSFLPCSREWLLAQIKEPAVSERGILVRQMAQRFELVLCDALVRLLAHHMGGNGATLVGSLKKLRLEHARWLDVSSVLRAAGLLFSEFQSSGRWDARDYAYDVTDNALNLAPLASGIAVRDFAIAMMRDRLGLPESAVAGYFGLDFGQVYQIASRTRAQLAMPEHAMLLGLWEDQFVSGLDSV